MEAARNVVRASPLAREHARQGKVAHEVVLRRAAAWRLEPMRDGRRDPLDPLEERSGEHGDGHRFRSWAAAARLVNEAGVAAGVPDDLVFPLRRAGLSVWPVGGEEAA